jgi:hypothetical protein
MRLGAKYVFMVSMDVAAEKEALFNEAYDREHIPNLLAVPGVLGVSRVKSQPFAVSIGGERKEMPAGKPFYTAIYELESPEGLVGDAWAQAVEAGPLRTNPPSASTASSPVRGARGRRGGLPGCRGQRRLC